MPTITDANYISSDTRKKMGDLDVLVINALRYEPHETHFSIDEAISVINEIQPHKAYLTHISHRLEHRETQSRLPKGVFMAYDGLTLDIAE